jgi:hypothetical protein
MIGVFATEADYCLCFLAAGMMSAANFMGGASAGLAPKKIITMCGLVEHIELKKNLSVKITVYRVNENSS